MPRPFRGTSIYELACACGKTFFVPDGATEATCPECKRVGVVEWRIAEVLVVEGEHAL